MARRRRHRQKPTNRSESADDSSTITIRQDSALCSKLYEASKNVPRYLFRMWHPGSGGNKRLNTTERIMPHAFFKGVGHRSMYDMPVDDFLDNSTRHPKGNRKVVSEFSSWAASPMFVFNYATEHRTTAYIAVIDTQELQDGDENAIFYVPDLQEIFGYRKGCGPAYDQYDWEYLVHGVVEGEHYRVNSFWRLGQCGLLDHLPSLKKDVDAWNETARLSLPGPVVEYDYEEAADLVNTSGLFAWGMPPGVPDGLRTFVAVALFCCKKRNLTALDEDELDEFVDLLGGQRGVSGVPRSWGDSRYLHIDRYDSRHYEDIRQIVSVMRAVYNHCWGENSRYQPTTPSIASDKRKYLIPRDGAYGINENVFAVPAPVASHNLNLDLSVFKRLHARNTPNSVQRRPRKGEHITFVSPVGFYTISSGDRIPLDTNPLNPKDITFQKIMEDGRSLWFAYVDRCCRVTINGLTYFSFDKSVFGPLPFETVWEYDGNIGVLWIHEPDFICVNLRPWMRVTLPQLAQGRFR